MFSSDSMGTSSLDFESKCSKAPEILSAVYTKPIDPRQAAGGVTSCCLKHQKNNE